MRRVLYTGLLAALVLAALVAPAAAATKPAAQQGQCAAGKYRTLPAALKTAVAQWDRAEARASRAYAATGPCTVNGTVLTVAGAACSGVEVELWCDDGTGAYEYGGYTKTSLTGAFQFTGVPETTDAMITAAIDADHAYQSWRNVVTAAGPNTFTLRPGLLTVTATRTTDPDWDYWRWVRIETYGTSGGGTTWIDSGTEAPATTTANALAMPPDCSYGIAYPFDNQGIEWTPSTSVSISVGGTAGTAAFDQDDGRGAWIRAPYWQSGKPGSTVKLVLENWPAGYNLDFSGSSQGPTLAARDWPGATASGSFESVATFTIPSTAPAGYSYEIHTSRVDSGSDLHLTSYFQVCTLKASDASIRKGQSIRLSGVIPTQGHYGKTAGKSKTVTVYKRTRSAGPPTTWDATKKGWTRVGTVKANGLGKYSSALLRPSRTTWYIVRYPNDAWYFGGYTSVLKVTVR